MDLTYWQGTNNPIDNDTITFRLIWFTTHHMINLMSLFSIILIFFFLIDFILTWRHPIRYLTGQKHVVPIFLLGAKIS